MHALDRRHVCANDAGLANPVATTPMKKLICLALLLLVAGCIPIGIRGQNLFAAPAAAPMRVA